MTAKPQNSISGTTIATAMPMKVGLVEKRLEGRDLPEIGTERSDAASTAPPLTQTIESSRHQPVDAVGGARLMARRNCRKSFWRSSLAGGQAARLQRRLVRRTAPGAIRWPASAALRPCCLAACCGCGGERLAERLSGLGCGLLLPLSRASSSAACEIWASRSSIEAAMSRSPSPPVRSKSRACFQFLCDVAVEIFGRRRFLRHAAVTLYKWRGAAVDRLLTCPHTRLNMHRRRYRSGTAG